MTLPDISVVIVNYNGRHHLEKCLPAVFASRCFTLEVIVVDNASRDDSRSWLAAHYPQVRVLPQRRNLGFGRANCLGVEQARAEKVALLNNDTEVTPEWLGPLVATLDRHPQVMAACSMLTLIQHPSVVNALGGGMSRLGFGYDRLFGCTLDHPRVRALIERESFPTLFPTAAAMLMRRRDFLALGGFDPAFFMYHEDVDLGWRIWLLGGEVRVCPASVVRHAFGGTTRHCQPARFRALMGMRHNVRTLWKCYQPRRIARAMLDLINLWHRRRAYDELLVVLAWNLWHLPGTLSARWRIQRRRTRIDRELFDSGLILRAALPPWGPEVPACPPDMVQPDALRAPCLRLGDETAGARLGYGWYSLEPAPNDHEAVPEAPPTLPATLEVVPCRWTDGLAQCWLWTAPHARGELTIRLRTPAAEPPAETTWVEVICGDASARQTRRWTFAACPGWARLTLPAQADAAGRLTIVLRSTIWAPEQADAGADARPLGCGVYDLVFTQTVPPLAALSTAPEDLSIVIPTYNRRAVLLRTLAALAAQTRQGFEVIVVDDGSTDGTAAAVARWQSECHAAPGFALKLLRQPNLKQGLARNRGLREARGGMVLFLGDDIVPEPEFVAAHLDAHTRFNRAGDVAIIGLTAWDAAHVRVTPFLNFVNYEGPQFGFRHLVAGAEAPFTCFYTSNVSLSRAALGEDPFDARFDAYGWEDCELGLRLCRQGLRIIYWPAARAVHSHPMTLASFLRRQRQVGEALRTFLAIQPEILTLPAMGNLRWNGVTGWFWPLLALFGPLLSMLDRRARRRWPAPFYALLVEIAFRHGLARARRAPWRPPSH